MDSPIQMPLLPTQRRLLRAVRGGQYKLLIWIGAIRSGKGVGTAVAMIDAAVRACRDGVDFVNNNYIVAGATQSSFVRNNEAYLQAAAERWGLGWQMKGSDKRGAHFELGPGVARFYLFGGDNARSFQMLRGLTARAAWLDEVTLLDELFAQTAMERCSFDESFTILTSNAGNPVHWVKTNYLDAGLPKTLSLASDFAENQYFSAEQRDWISQVNPFTANYRRAIGNEWTPDEGLVYPLPDHAIIRGHPNVPLRGTVVVDPGVGSTTAALLFARHTAGYVVIADEYYHLGDRYGRLTDDEHLDRILARGWQIERLIIDPAAAPFRQVCLRRGLTPQYAINDKERGIQVTLNTLYSGKLRIHEGCVNLQMEASALRWNPRETGTEVGPDHLCDTMRYGALDFFPTEYAMFFAGA